MLLGLTEISGGEVSVLGFNPAREPLSVKRRVGYMPDTVGFYDQMTAVDNLELHGASDRFQASRTGKKNCRRARARRPDRGRRKPRRHVLARHAPTAGPRRNSDERRARSPFSTSRHRGSIRRPPRELLAIIRGFKGEGVTVLLSSHLLERVQSVCDRVALFRGGHIVLMGTVAELGREVLGGGYVVDIEAEWRRTRRTLGAYSRRLAALSGPASASCGCMPTATFGPKPRRKWCAMQGRLKSLGVQEPSLDAIYTRYFAEAQERKRQTRSPSCSVKAPPFKASASSCSRSCPTT